MTLVDHFAATEINLGSPPRPASSSFDDGLAQSELDQLRNDFLRKAVLAATDRVCRPLLEAGRHPEELAGLDATRPAVARTDPLRACRRQPARRGRRRPGRRPGDRRPVEAAGLALTCAGPASPGSASRPTARCAGLLGSVSRTSVDHPVEPGSAEKAVRLHRYHTQPILEDVPEPVMTDRWRIVKIAGRVPHRSAHHRGAVGREVRRALPYTIGHENAGWVEAVGWRSPTWPRATR